MDSHETIPYTIVAFGAALLLIAQFGRKFRARSLWYRCAFLLLSCVCITWSTLGFFLASHHTAGHTDLPWSRFWFVDHIKSDMGGVAVGIFIALVISPEFWRRSVRATPASNQPLEPTAGRPTEGLKCEYKVKGKLVAASGGSAPSR
jgi:hypothetical protein